jgi:hypothetical protein
MEIHIRGGWIGIHVGGRMMMISYGNDYEVNK